MPTTGSGGAVLVLNSGSSSLKFALMHPSSGDVLMEGKGERLGTPQASLRVQWFPSDAVEEQLGDGDSSHHAVVTRVLEQLAESRHADLALLGAGHRVVHGGERFTSSILVDDEVLAELRSFTPLAPLQTPANIAGIEAARAP